MLEDDEWQDVEVSEEWGPQTPLTPLNDEDDDDEDQDDQGDPDDLIQMRHSSGSASRNMIDSRYSVRWVFTSLIGKVFEWVIIKKPRSFQLPPPPPPPRCAHNLYDLGLTYNPGEYVDDQCDSTSDDCTECAQIAAATAASKTSSHSRKLPPPPNCLSRNGRGGLSPPPPMRLQEQQLLRCPSLANNYSRTMPNSYSRASSCGVVSQQCNRSQTVVRQAQTQTETKMSCLKQFMYCLLANEVN